MTKNLILQILKKNKEAMMGILQRNFMVLLGINIDNIELNAKQQDLLEVELSDILNIELMDKRSYKSPFQEAGYKFPLNEADKIRIGDQRNRKINLLTFLTLQKNKNSYIV